MCNHNILLFSDYVAWLPLFLTLAFPALYSQIFMRRFVFFKYGCNNNLRIPSFWVYFQLLLISCQTKKKLIETGYYILSHFFVFICKTFSKLSSSSGFSDWNLLSKHLKLHAKSKSRSQNLQLWPDFLERLLLTRKPKIYYKKKLSIGTMLLKELCMPFSFYSNKIWLFRDSSTSLSYLYRMFH